MVSRMGLLRVGGMLGFLIGIGLRRDSRVRLLGLRRVSRKGLFGYGDGTARVEA